MRILRKLPALCLAVCLAVAMSMTAYAHETPDMSRTGTISFTMLYGETAVPGGSLTLYRVGEICEDDGNYSFALTDGFTDSGVSLDDLSSAALASELASYVSENRPASVATVTIGSDGKASASGLTLGLYLVVQDIAADGYEPVSPFLVSVPMNEDGSYIYDVDATPKVSTLTETEPTKPATPTDPTLPQTGQLNWPVPVMAALGLCLLLLGFALRCGRKGMPYEA